MKNIIWVFFVVLCIFFSAPSSAALVFKITSDQTNLTVGQTTTVHVWGWADDPLAIGTNGLNTWQLSAMVDTTGIVEVVSGSVVFVAPSPWSTNSSDTGFASINAPSTGTVDYLRLMTADLPQDSSAGVGGYTEIARFDIEAIGTVGASVTYTLGGANFGGNLRDFIPSFDESYILSGSFNANDSQRIFTIVPEPSSLVILSGLWGASFLTRRKK
jgi:hypothetical protein